MSRSGAGRPRPTSRRNQHVAGQERPCKLPRKTLVARELAEPCHNLLVLVSEVALVRGELVGRQDTLFGQKRLPSREHRLPPLRPEQIKLAERTGGEAVIGSLAELAEVAAGRSGTRVELLAANALQ